MTVEMFGIDFAELMGDVFAGQLEAATIERTTQTLDAYGQPVNSWTSSATEGVLSRWDDRIRVARGYPVEAARIMLLAHGHVRPTVQDRIGIQGGTWRVIDVRSGAGAATYEIAGVLI